MPLVTASSHFDFIMRPSSHSFAKMFASLSLLACAWIAGCAAPGAPTPPTAIVPKAITDLAARQQASSMILTFTPPKQSVDNEKLTEPPDLEIFRAERQPGAPGKFAPRLVYSVPSALVESYMKNGQIEFRDSLESGSLTGQELVYTVRTRASKKRASEDSNVVSVLALPVPGAPSEVRSTVTETAIELSWSQPVQSPAINTISGYRVYRVELPPGTAPPANVSDISQSKLPAPLEMLGPAPTTSFRDSNFSFDTTYIYMVRSVADEQGQSVESADSTAVVVTPKDVFPPAAPQGLVAVIPPATEGPATQQTPVRVELSWGISPELDLSGYWVYRSEQPDTPGQRINGQLLLTPAFRDVTAVPGQRYTYRVSAVDRAGNESSFSSPVSVDVPRRDP
jgi:hypothetical protein